jgi:hypothetical protein
LSVMSVTRSASVPSQATCSNLTEADPIRVLVSLNLLYFDLAWLGYAEHRRKCC